MLSLFAFLSLASFVSCQIFNLSVLSWSLRSQNGSLVVPGSVPSQAHLDLLRAGIITEPVLGANGLTLLFRPRLPALT